MNQALIRLLLIFFCYPGLLQTRESTMNDLDKIINKEVENHKTPSVQYVHFNEDSVLFTFQSGYADIQNQVTVGQKTTYNAFSVTKTFTALAILQLAEQEKLSIDASVKHYLPDFPYSSDITIRQLLSHSAGIPNPIPLSWIHLTTEHQTFNRNDFFKSIFKENKKTKSKPNEKYSYSNLGYVLLGQIIEIVSGASYENYIEVNIIKAMGVTAPDLGFSIDSVHHAKGYLKKVGFTNLILGMFMDKSEEKWKPFKKFYVNGSAYGGLIGNLNGFRKYIQELLKSNSRLISNKYKKMLFSENHTNRNKATGMCLSWFKGQLNGIQYFTHAGGGGGYYCEIRIYPELGRGSVIMFNRTGVRDERFLDKVDQYYIRSN